jgi:D-alanyl-D-alanine carboxypeptidase/D-alanyl-D-alanine-endopeptidase (penicillin-binding protein 4)
VLGPLLGAPELGSRVSAAVLDAATGRALFTRAGGRAATPASTTKIATAVAVLSTAGPEHRIATRAVRDSAESDTVTLIGGGDPTLTAEARAPRAGSSSAEQSGLSEHAEHPASLSALAAAAARELKRSGTTSITLNYDLSAYTGPRLHRIGQDENLAETVSLMADEGRVNPRSTEQAPRHPDPAAVAAKKFAELLEKQGITVRGTPKERTAPKRPAALAVVRSQPVSQLVERMLTDSDNDLGEALARQTAIATGAEPSFDGAGTAVRRALKKAGIDTTGCLLHDGSGLDRRNRLSADALTGLLAMAAAPEHPELRPVLTGLPVAGFTGTLGGRYRGAGTSGGAGLVRAKTGSLTGVNTLSGTATTSRGRLLLFAFLTDDSADATRARRALDRAAAALTG